MKRKRKRNLYHLWFCFAMLLFLAVPFKVKAETATTPVSISVQYGQTEARTILNMINEMRTSSTDAWYWKQDDTTKTYCTNLQPLQYDYDLEKTAMQRAAEIAIIYSHTRPNNKDTFSAFYENSVYYTYAGENIAAGYGTADSVNDGWREDNELYAGQGHRRNMLNSKFNCVGIGHVYYNGFHYWVENFAYRDKVNTTPVSADNTETTLTIPVATSKISNFNITFDKDEYSLKTGESTSISVSDPAISVFGHWGSRFVFVTDTPDLTIADSTVATLSGTITGISEGDTTISASLYGLTAHHTAAVKVHNCENHWDDGKITTAPTCTKTGVKQYTCTICSETKTEEIAALGHDYSSDWTIDTAAACETVGSKSHHCTRCDSKKDVTEIPASGHFWNDGAITTEPTCTDEGVKTFTCNACGKTRTEAVAALGHNYSSDWTIDTAAVCETVGSKSHHCTRCDSKKDVTEIPASGHSWNDGAITTEPTCTDEGVKTFTCNACGKTRTEAVAALGHNYSSDWTIDTAAVCETVGSKSHHCTRCDSKIDVTEIPASGKHTWNNGVITKPATIAKEGVKTYTCTVCGVTRTETIAKLPMPTVTPVPTATPTPAITSAPTVTPTPSVSVGTKITDKKTGNIYKVTSSRSSSQTVAFIGNKVKTSVTIPTTIKIKGATYKVTEISTNAFKNNRKLKKVVIGQNIVRIGKNAFYGCKKLTSITIKSSRLTLKNIGKNAFKNTSPKATVKVPKKQKALYNQILKKRGLNKKAKVK
ncbi:leucine-rich repeat protein [Blautia faecis]|uniref:leucine-rich repeat protein n=1 Tax=Blautia faecis TaxID=871665 RepID=UPI001655BAB0|nr:leucine-rich repeat protein [Blautia faecis]MBC8615860.1 leucine-rich repeat protein [Blautia faecis]